MRCVDSARALINHGSRVKGLRGRGRHRPDGGLGTERPGIQPRGHEVLSALEALPIPGDRAVNGFALGGGCDAWPWPATSSTPPTRLASASRRSSSASFPGFGGTQRLARLVGTQVARELIYTGRMIAADEALRIASSPRLTPPRSYFRPARKLVEEISQVGPRAVAAAKRAILDGFHRPLTEASEVEAAAFAELFRSERAEGRHDRIPREARPEVLSGRTPPSAAGFGEASMSEQAATRILRVLIRKARSGRPRPGSEDHRPGVARRWVRGDLLRAPPDPEQIVNTAIQEDVDGIGLSVLSGAHEHLFAEVIRLLREREADDIFVFGGGVIPAEDVERLKALGVLEVFTPGTRTDEVIAFLRAQAEARQQQ